MNRWIEFALIFISGIVGTLLYGNGSGRPYYLASPIFIIIICEIIIEHNKKIERNRKRKTEDDYEYDMFLNDVRKNSTIKCQVCNKEIPYNENGTCDECHKEILKRLELKNKK